MRLKQFSASLLALMLAATPASAEWYFAGNVGANLLTDSDFDNRVGTVVEAEFEPGIVLSGEIGFSFPENFRLGVEVAYRANDVDRFRGAGSSSPGTAEANAASVMGNFWYDVPTNNRVRPFVGFGVGLAILDVDNVANGAIAVDDQDGTFAFQAGAGLAFEIAPEWALTIEYRYFHAVDPSFSTAEAEYNSHAVLGGLRFKF